MMPDLGKYLDTILWSYGLTLLLLVLLILVSLRQAKRAKRALAAFEKARKNG